MLNGAIQMMNDGIIPGNHNLDDLDANLRRYQYLKYHNKTFKPRADGDGVAVKSVLLKSFGFGQIGAEVLAVNPFYLFRCLPENVMTQYMGKLNIRRTAVRRRRLEILSGMEPLIRVKDLTYHNGNKDLERSIMLDPCSRIHLEKDVERRLLRDVKYANETGTSSSSSSNSSHSTITSTESSSISNDENSLSVEPILSPVRRIASEGSPFKAMGIGVDIVEAFVFGSEAWVSYNFTTHERAVCEENVSRMWERLWGRWAAKEAVYKAISNAGNGMAINEGGQHKSMKDVEIVTRGDGSTVVQLHNDAKLLAEYTGIKSIQASISYSESRIIGYAIAQ